MTFEGVNRRELAFKALAGLGGGAIGWIPVEIVTHGHTLAETPTSGQVIANYIAMAILSGLVGGAIVAAEGQQLALTPLAKRGFVRGFAICLLLSFPATYWSNLAFSAILNASGANPANLSFFQIVPARLAGWTLMGLMLGAGVGIASLSLPNIAKGLLGGAAGGAAGGLLFDLLSFSAGGLVSRLIGFSAIGFAIGLLIGLVQELTKTAWLTVEAGRLRGRSFRLERPIVSVGRAEENEIGLFGDPSVVARHARIERSGTNFAIKSLAVQEGVFVNGNRIESAPLHDGDRLRIGGYELAFHERKTAGASTSAAIRPQARPIAAVSAKNASLIDASGNQLALRAGGETRLGRALDNEIVLNHSSVSRYHALIDARDGIFELRDLNSRNGTFVADRRVDGARLRDGDAIRLGDVRFTFRG